MSTEYLERRVRNGRNILKFKGRVLGAATSERANASRWSELAVYGLNGPDGGYIRSKIGRSLVVHDPGCGKVRHWMSSWAALNDAQEQSVRRVPCLECQPSVAGGIDPQLIVESTHYTATMASDVEALFAVLMEGRPGDPPFTPSSAPHLIRSVLAQVRDADELFADLLVRNGHTVPVVNRPLNHGPDSGRRTPREQSSRVLPRQGNRVPGKV